MHLIFVKERKHEVHITLEIKEYVIPKVVKSKLIKLSKKVKPTLIVVKYSEVISSKFKVVKFIV